MKPLELTNLETAGLCRQLALLMHSGVAAGDSLSLLAEEEENKKIRALLEGMTAAMDSGAYHAWISVWSEDTGWVDGVIFFDGTTWQRLDPTFASSANQSEEIMKYIGNGSNYREKYFY